LIFTTSSKFAERAFFIGFIGYMPMLSHAVSVPAQKLRVRLETTVFIIHLYSYAVVSETKALVSQFPAVTFHNAFVSRGYICLFLLGKKTDTPSCRYCYICVEFRGGRIVVLVFLSPYPVWKEKPLFRFMTLSPLLNYGSYTPVDYIDGG
jgi:hypothetical protein